MTIDQDGHEQQSRSRTEILVSTKPEESILSGAYEVNKDSGTGEKKKKKTWLYELQEKTRVNGEENTRQAFSNHLTHNSLTFLKLFKAQKFLFT